MTKERDYAFYQWSIADVEHYFNVVRNEGLSDKSIHFRHQKYGSNQIKSDSERGVWGILFSQAKNYFIYLLLIAAIVSYFVDGLLQSLIIIVIICLNIILGFFQEFKAEKAMLALRQNLRAKCKVLRSGKIKTIDSVELVPGDIVLLDTGDLIPADLRIIESNSLRTNESALTGESTPVGKYDQILPIDTPVADRRNILFGSTTVVAGRGRGIVVAIGLKTEFGKIANMISKPEGPTPLEKQIAYLGRTLTLVSIVSVAILFALGYLRGYEPLPLLTFTIALLVSAVPESLPTIITLALAIGVSKMAKKKAIVRKLAVIEALGATNIIATDKTGTLTDNKLKVAESVIYSSDNIEKINLEDRGSYKEGVYYLLEKGLICSNIDNKETGEVIGDPLEVAIHDRSKEFHRGIVAKAKNNKRLMEVPFDSENKYMAVLAENYQAEKYLIVKGAPEKILSLSKINSNDKQKLENIARDLSAEGLKVIAIAEKIIDKKSFSSVSGLKFLGMLGFIDEPSEGIKEAIKKTMEAGIRPIIITGDHSETARFVAEKIGFTVADDEIISGSDFTDLDSKQFAKALEKVKIFARISPADKIKIVESLEKSGYVVTVTGDGVNDAPALKRASIGVAMGVRGTDVAKESADIILSDDRYGTIISAIEYGRAVYDNIKKSITFLLSGSFGELFLIGIAFVFDLPMPLVTIQILWINLVTDSLPALALAFEEPHATILRQKPRSGLAKSMRGPIGYAIYLAVIVAIIGTLLFLWGLHYSVDKARTMVFNYVVFTEILYVFSIRSPYRFWQKSLYFIKNRFLIVSVILVFILQGIISFKPLSKVFGTTKLDLVEIGSIVAATVISFLGAEIVRHLIDRKKAQ